MRLVVIESPFAGDLVTNLAYLRAAMRDCLLRGEAPYASHALYTQPGVLDDKVPTDRALGMEAGFAWSAGTDATIVYRDLGITPGMRAGITRAEASGRLVEYRTLGENWRAAHNKLAFPFTCAYCKGPTSMPPYLDGDLNRFYPSACVACAGEWEPRPLAAATPAERKVMKLEA
jgi:hypothetical protein